MQINGLDVQFQTALFVPFLIAAIVLTARKDPRFGEFNRAHTSELKGIAILMVLFSHIGYFLFSDHSFLYPLSVAGGVGVNIFLFLSGFGLTLAQNKTQLTPVQFYFRRLKSIFIPMWLVLIATLILDNYLLGRTYSLSTIIQSFFGFFPNGDINSAINSPLWYFTLIFFYYLIFPLVYRKNKTLLSIGVVLLLGYIVSHLKLPVTKDVLKLYQLHYLAFPLGMVLARLNPYRLKTLVNVRPYIRYFLLIIFLGLFGYLAIHSGVGEKLIPEQFTSLLSVLVLLVIVLIKDFQSNLLILLGKYSYEIYLIQWPVMYRFDFIYKYTPPFLGTILYIAIFIAIGFALNRIVKVLRRLPLFSLIPSKLPKNSP